MAELCHNRLTVFSSNAQLQQFQDSYWDRCLRARHGELLENSPGGSPASLKRNVPHSNRSGGYPGAGRG